MKKHLFFLILILFICSCEHNLNLSDDMATSEYKEDPGPYTFEKVTDPAVWRTYNSLEEMMNACQLPQEMLEAMSTESLIQTLMNHPLFFIYSAYNNELDGVNVILDNFNGFKELQNRVDAAEKVIDYYSATDVGSMVRATADNSRKSKDLTIYHLDFLELVIATKKIPDILSSKNTSRLNEVMNEKYEAKLSHANNVSLFSIRKSLILGAEIKLSQNTLDLNDREILQDFIRAGGNAAQDKSYADISEIIYLKK